MAKSKKTKDYAISSEGVLFGLALSFLKTNDGVSKDEFADKFISYLEMNNFLRSDDLKLRGDLGLSRESEKAIEVTVRNLYSSHDTLLRTGQVLEKNGCFHLAKTGSTTVSSVPRPALRSTGMENVIYYGPPGTGKTYLAKRQNIGLKPTLIQFHASYTYEHFVQGERLVSIGDQRTTQIIDGPLMICYRRATNTPVRTKVCGRINAETKDLEIIFPTGLLARYAINEVADLLVSFDPGDDTAFMQPASLYGATARFPSSKIPKALKFERNDFLEVEFRAVDWENETSQLLIIDEINRADTSRVFGELMTALADIDDFGNAVPIVLQYSGEEFKWPENLRLIGTMNSADRSIGEIDQAMKRRFKIIECPPLPGLLKSDELKKIRIHFDEISHGINLAKLSKSVKSVLKLDRATCDVTINFYNCLVQASAKNSGAALPVPSTSLKNLHDILMEKNDSIFAVKRKLIGHSFHMEISQNIAERLSRGVDSGQLTDVGIDEVLAKEIYSHYSEFVEQEIKPQIASICLENDVLIEEIITAWKKKDAQSLVIQSVRAVDDKAVGE